MSLQSKPKLQVIVLLILMAGVCIRIYGSCSDLWLDELWSLGYALNASSLSSIVFNLKIDNNHILNTLFLYGIGSVSSSFLYRILSLSSGMILLLALYREGRRDSEGASWTILSVLMSMSFLVILYATEARGYGTMACCLIISLMLLQRFVCAPSYSSALGFWLYAALGLLAQFSYALFFLAAPWWTLCALWKRHTLKETLHWALVLWLPTAIGASLLYMYYIADIPPGTGYLYSSPFEVLLNSLLLTFGLPSVSASMPAFGALSLLFFLFTLCIVASWLYQLYTLDDERWIYFLFILFLVPLFVVLVLSPRIFCTRYIFVVVVSFYWLFSIILEHTRCGRLPSQSIALWCLILIFVCGNVYATGRFALYLRGKPQSALHYLQQQTTQYPVSIQADNDYRTQMMLAYYWPRLTTKRYRYISASSPEQADWYLFQTRDQFLPLEAMRCLDADSCYCFEKQFPFSAESGWEWRLYRRCTANET